MWIAHLTVWYTAHRGNRSVLFLLFLSRSRVLVRIQAATRNTSYTLISIKFQC